MSERHSDRGRCQRGRTRRLRRRWRLRRLIEALRARILTPIDAVNPTGGQARRDSSWTPGVSANRHGVLFTVVIRKRGTCNARTEHTS